MSSRDQLPMFPATSPSETIVFSTHESSARIFTQCAAKASHSRGGKAAISIASGSFWCSKKIGMSSSATSRRTWAMAGDYAALQV